MVQFGVIKEQGVAITSNPIFFTFSTFPNGSQPKPLLSHPKRNSVRRMTVQTHSMELYAIFPCEPLGARIKTDCRLDPYFPFSRMTGKPTHKKIKIQNDSLGRLNLGHQHLLQTFCLSFSPSPPFPPNSPLLSLSFDKGMLGESFDSQLVDQRWGGRGEREKKKFLPGKKRKMLLSPQVSPSFSFPSFPSFSSSFFSLPSIFPSCFSFFISSLHFEEKIFGVPIEKKVTCLVIAILQQTNSQCIPLLLLPPQALPVDLSYDPLLPPL